LSKLLVLVLLAICAVVCAESLREGISSKVLASGSLNDLETVELHDNDPVVIDFNSNSTNVTNPYDIWNTLPDWIRYLFGSVIILVGIVITFYGVRLLHLSVFIMGGFVAAILTYGILAAAVPNDNLDKTAIVYGTSFAVWIVAGIILACCINFAVFVLGCAFGAVVALILNPICLKYVWPAAPLANTIIWVIVFGLIGGLIACCLKRPLLIAATACGGSFAVIAESMAMAGNLHIGVSTVDGLPIPTTWQDWTGFAGFLALAVFGIIIQVCFTAGTTNNEGYRKFD